MRSRLLSALLVAACGGSSTGDDGGGGSDAPRSDARPAADAAEPTCTPAAGTNLALQLVVDGLGEPVLVTTPPGDARLFVVEQPGQIRVVAGGSLLPEPFLDIRDPVRAVGGEEGLLGLAFHPDYAANGRFFVYYTADDPDGDLVIAEYQVGADPDHALTEERRLLIIPHPDNSNHNGGNLGFGPDGYLYMGVGDGGGGGDPDDSAQTASVLLGKLLRIDVDSGDPYGIPASNPFAGTTGGEREELWALGLRNPWRWSFDRQTGDLYIGDVGQGDREEIDIQPAADPGPRNYGWNRVEGECCFPVGTVCNTIACDMTGLTPPVVTYSHDGGRCSVTGGHVYRGSCLPDIQGWYFYADYCSRQIWRIAYPDDLAPVELTGDLGSETLGGISSFGQDATGELYVVSRGGAIYQIVSGN